VLTNEWRTIIALQRDEMETYQYCRRESGGKRLRFENNISNLTSSTSNGNNSNTTTTTTDWSTSTEISDQRYSRRKYCWKISNTCWSVSRGKRDRRTWRSGGGSVRRGEEDYEKPICENDFISVEETDRGWTDRPIGGDRTRRLLLLYYRTECRARVRLFLAAKISNS